MILPYLSLQSLFRYDSSYWTRTITHNNYSHGLNGGLDNREYKGTTYWRTPFQEICVGMKHNDSLRAFTFSYQASSLYSLIADGKYCPTYLRRFKWKSLISESSLQRNCDREGFNVYNSHTRVRLGILASDENDCNTPDTFIRLGAYRYGNVENAASIMLGIIQQTTDTRISKSWHMFWSVKRI